MSCQICFDEPSAKDSAATPLITQLCSQACSAQICVNCLTRHVEVSLERVYTGMLPKIRCPICLVVMNKSRWQDRITSDNDMGIALLRQYANLCKGACSLTPPCCHKDEYTHLPDSNPAWYPDQIPKVLPSKIAEFRKLCRRFCRHKEDARKVVQFVVTQFGERHLYMLMQMTLVRILDEERRATLLLSYMYMYPNTLTQCCEFAICFNCKRTGHHDRCDEAQEVVEADCLVRCRSCRAMLLKVEGCDSVHCPCGFNMGWAQELHMRALYKKGVVPVDLFDQHVFESWYHHQQNKQPLLLVEATKAYTTRREMRLLQWIETYKPLLSSWVSSFIWHFRYQKMIATIERELYWKAYHREHPGVSEAEETEALADLFAMDL